MDRGGIKIRLIGVLAALWALSYAPLAAKATEMYNERAAAQMITGYDLLESGNKEAALDTIATAMRLDPGSTFLKVLYCEVLFAMNRYKEILRTLGPLVKDADNADAQAVRMMAVSLQATGKTDDAIDWYKKLLERNPGEEWARRHLLELLNSEGRFQEMIPVYKVLLDPESENYAFDCFQMGALYLRIGGNDPARQYLEEALGADSSMADAHKLLAHLDEIELKYTNALDHYMQYLELKPEDAETVLPQVMGAALRAAYPAYSGDSVNSEDAWRTLLDRLEKKKAEGDSLNPVFRRVVAIAYEATGRPDEAIKLYNEILDENPGDRFTRRSLLRVLYGQGRYKEMIPLYEPLLDEQDNNYAHDLFQIGMLELRTGDETKARQYMEQSVAADSTFADPCRVLGNICDNKGDWAAAQTYYLNYLSLKPDSDTEIFDRLLAVSMRGGDLGTPIKYFETRLAEGDTSAATRESLGRLYYHGEQYERAQQLLEPLAASGALSDNGTYTLGFLYSRLEHYPQALDAFEKVRAALPDFLPVYLTLSRVYYTMKEYDKALEVLEAGLPKVKKGDAEGRREVLFSMANVYHEQKDYANTVKYLRQVLQESPDFAPALNYLGYYYAERGENLEEARRLVDRALKTEPDNGSYIDSKGWVLFKMGRREEALKEIKNALATVGDQPEIYEHLGDVYFSLGQKKEAVDAWKKSLKMDSDNKELKVKLDRVESGTTGEAGGRK